MPDDDCEIWFPVKRYGWGWGLPRAWQGRVALGMYAMMLVTAAFTIDPEQDAVLLMGWVVGWTILLLVVTWLRGEPPVGIGATAGNPGVSRVYRLAGAWGLTPVSG